MSNTSLKLYSNPICPYAHRAWWALKEKELYFEFINIPLGPEKPAWYKDINPRATVPTLQHNSYTILESAIIVEYLEDAFPNRGTRLLPKEPHLRAAVRLFLDQSGQAITALYKLLRNQENDKEDEFREDATKKLKELLNVFSIPFKGPFLLGDELSLADIAFLPFLVRFSATLKHYRSFDIFEVDERFKTWLDAAKSRKAFQETTDDAQYYIEGYSTYAKTAATSRP